LGTGAYGVAPRSVMVSMSSRVTKPPVDQVLARRCASATLDLVQHRHDVRLVGTVVRDVGADDEADLVNRELHFVGGRQAPPSAVFITRFLESVVLTRPPRPRTFWRSFSLACSSRFSSIPGISASAASTASSRARAARY
jgi:hypothetical protein